MKAATKTKSVKARVECLKSWAETNVKRKPKNEDENEDLNARFRSK